MTRRIRLAPRAEADLDEHFLHLARESMSLAERFIEAANETFRFLASDPSVGKPRRFRAVTIKDLRSWPVTGFHNHLVFYSSDRTAILVVRVLHGARDLPAAMRERTA